MKRILLFVIIFLLIFCGCKTQSKTDNIVEEISTNLHRDYGKGNGVRVAVIDSGTTIDKANSKYVLNFSEQESVVDFIDHGVPIENIISNKEYGIAPEATVYSLKVINEYGNASTQAVYNALEWCLNNSIDIINISLSFGIHSENIECIVTELVERGVIIVASINNTNKKVDYPSMYKGVICVGKTNLQTLYSEDKSIIFADEYTISAIGCDGKMKDYVGNSFLTPVATGIIACLIDKNNTERRFTDEELINNVKSLLIQNDIKIN